MEMHPTRLVGRGRPKKSRNPPFAGRLRDLEAGTLSSEGAVSREMSIQLPETYM